MSDKSNKSPKIKIRREWRINPKTQVVESKKQYNRAQIKRDTQQEQQRIDDSTE
jgi:hypothetical protein